LSSSLIHVGIVEDNDEIRQTLALIIDGTPGYSCKMIFSNAEAAVEALRNSYVNVVLMDIELPGMTGIEAVKQLKPSAPDMDFLMLTIRQDDESIFQSICAGATGYLVKDTPPTALLQAIQEVADGGAPMSTSIARKVIRSFHSTKPSPLSSRETEILKLLCDGLNYRSIAQQLFLSAHTVKSHIKNIYKKLHVNSRAEAVGKALKDKLI